MKTKRKLLFIFSALVLFSLFLPIFSLAGSNTTHHTVPVHKRNKTENKHEDYIKSEGNRIPARPILIEISKNEGVTIPVVEQNDVISYEAYDENEMLLMSTDDDVEFANFVLDYDGTVMLKIGLTDYDLIGFL